MRTITLETTLDWQAIAGIAEGAPLVLGEGAWDRIDHAARIVATLVKSGIRAYGVNTGVGALADTVVDRASQRRLSRNILMSHACGVGPLLAPREVRAIIAAQINNFAHGHSGVRPQIVRAMLALLDHDCVPDVPAKGSAGYLTHMAHIALVIIGEGTAHLAGRRMSGAEALAKIGIEPLVLEAKEGLSLVNGTSCSTGLGCIALARAGRLLEWADAIAAMTLEALGAQMPAFEEGVLALRRSKGIETTGRALRARLAGSGLIAANAGARTQDALSLRAIPHAHGAARDGFDFTADTVDRELASVTDNPAVSGTPEAPQVWSQAHAVAPALSQALDMLAVAIAQISAMSERRIDRLVNPLVSGLPAFLADDPGAGSGFMIAQYTAAALSNENRRLGLPASLDGGITSALQEDFLAHPTAAAVKLLAMLDNAEQIFAIELLAAAQALDLRSGHAPRARGTDVVYRALRAILPRYVDDRPLAQDMAAARNLLAGSTAPAVTDI
ncbi:histidine ammonia-lyase [Phyllobacterium salinisoli]|uniref:Histidine ammonia-lyase n=1 Tax=Phyllobacterium salinisoli TaxID=1899321 RepID=A0A368K5W5_9HYPH|nr:histidine ammonia-lyase [Phyllobacterium salinisoli]RCS24759.1 histidine ammonia-lyase [Phyllobacterium salinisoli]